MLTPAQVRIKDAICATRRSISSATPHQSLATRPFCLFDATCFVAVVDDIIRYCLSVSLIYGRRRPQ